MRANRAYDLVVHRQGRLFRAEGDFRYDGGGDVFDEGDFVVGPDARLVVDHAQRSDGVSVPRDEGHAQVGDHADSHDRRHKSDQV